MMHSTESNLPKEKNILLYDEDKNGFAISAKRKSKTRFSEQSYTEKNNFILYPKSRPFGIKYNNIFKLKAHQLNWYLVVCCKN